MTETKALRLLHMEDSEDDSFLVQRTLTKAGYLLDYKRKDNLEDFRQELDDSWDIIITDFHLPGFTGLDVLAIVKDTRIDIPFIIISGVIGEDVAVNAMRSGAHDYLMKDNLTRLPAAVARELQDAEVRRKKHEAEGSLKAERFNLQERLKEQKLLYDILWICSQQESSVADILNQIVKRIPPAWQFPEMACAQIIVNDAVYQTENWVQPSLFLESPIRLRNRQVGIVKVGYVQDISDRCTPAFFEEEQLLINSIGYHIATLIESTQNEEMGNILLAAIEHTDDIVVITNRDACIEYVNPAFERVTGYTVNEVIGKNPRILKSGKQDDEFYKNLWCKISDGDVWSGHFVNKKKSGELYEEFTTISPVRDRSGDISNYVSVKRDITQQVRMEQQLHQADKMSALGELAGGIAHDFNNQLSGMLGFAQILMGNLTDEKHKRYTSNIITCAKRSAEIIKQLLMFSRKREIQYEMLDVHAVIHETVNLLSHSLDKRISIVPNLDSAKYHILGESTYLQNAFLNLGVNARDAMPGGGTLSFSSKTVSIDDTNLHTRGADLQPGEYICISISDTGFGMNEETLAHIFEPFYTTKELGKGTGMGLAAVYGTVKQHHGHITVESTLGEGTTFFIYLPLAASSDGNHSHETAILTSEKDLSVLVIDDDQIVNDMATDMLNMLGYKTTAFTSACKAIEFYRCYWQTIDIVLLDMIMPEIGGAETLQRLREINPSIRCVMASGHQGDEPMDALKKLGVSQFISKPYEMGEFSQAIASAWSQHQLGCVP